MEERGEEEGRPGRGRVRLDEVGQPSNEQRRRRHLRVERAGERVGVGKARHAGELAETALELGEGSGPRR